MKSKIAFAAGLTAGVLIALSATLIAGQVTGLVSFSAGTPAKAAEVNGNFSVVQAAVDDNNARIAALETKLSKFGTNTGLAANGNASLDACVVGEIRLFAGNVAGALPAKGQLLPISQNTALFSLLGANFGGDGTSTFALPDLRGAAPDGLTYAICTIGIFPSPI
jgi:hypothetical protein